MKVAKKILRTIKNFSNIVLGSCADKIFWRFRHLFDKDWAKSYISQESLNHRHRKLLVEKISACVPFESVLELGCASGPNLYLLAKKFPNKKFLGIDISKKAIKTGRDYFKKEKINNVFLNAGRAEDLKKIRDKSIDIIFTDATLIYFDARRIERIIEEFLRIAKKSIFLFEMHQENSLMSVYKDNWIHNYKALFRKLSPKTKITINAIPKGVWPGIWEEKGNIIEIDL